MERVANYFAEIGFRVDRESVDKVNKSFEEIERKLSSFKKQASSTKIAIKAQLDSRSLERVSRQAKLLEKSIRPLNLRANIVSNNKDQEKVPTIPQHNVLKLQQESLALDKNKNLAESVNKSFEVMERRLATFVKSVNSTNLTLKAQLDRNSLGRIKNQIRLLERGTKPIAVRADIVGKVKKQTKVDKTSQRGPLKAQQDAILLERNKALVEAVGGVRKAVIDVQKEVKTLNTSITRQQNRRGTTPPIHPLGVGGGSNRRPAVGLNYGRRSVRGTTQSSTTNSSSGVGSDGMSRRSSSPFHNPFMLGGFTGAITRYGAHALPLFGGVIGAQALTRAAVDTDRQVRSLDMAAAISGTGNDGDYYRAFLDRLGKDLGLASSSMVDSFTYMINNVGGSGLSNQLEQGFASIIRYTTIMGKTEQEQDATIKALAKVMTKPYATAQEIKGTPTDNLPFIFRIMAETLAGGDNDKLVEMLSKKQVNPKTDFPKVFAAMDREAAPFMQSYYDSPMYASNEYGRLMDNWMTTFLESGGTEAVNGFLRVLNQTLGSDKALPEITGKLVDKFSALLQIGMLVPQEVVDYVKGDFDYENFMENIFGTRQIGDIFDNISGTFEALDVGIKDIINFYRDGITGISSESREDYEKLGTVSKLLAESLTGLGISPESSISSAKFVGESLSNSVKFYFQKMEEHTKSQVQMIKDLWSGDSAVEGQEALHSEFIARDLISKYGEKLGAKTLQQQRDLLEPLTEVVKGLREGSKSDKGFQGEVLGELNKPLWERLMNVISGNLPRSYSEQDIISGILNGSIKIPIPSQTREQSVVVRPDFRDSNMAPIDRSVRFKEDDSPFNLGLLETLNKGYETIDSVASRMSEMRPNVNANVTNNVNLTVEFSGVDVRDESEAVTAFRNIVKQELDNIYTSTSATFMNVIN